jgi:hypothetical protein
LRPEFQLLFWWTKAFENWDQILNRADFRPYECKRCGFKVKTPEQWVRGRAVCRQCFDSMQAASGE